MHASPSNSETVCDVKLPCFVTKTVCMSKQNNSDLDYTFKRKKINGLVPFFFILSYIAASWTTSRVPINLGGFFFFYLLCQFVFCFVINTILSNKTHVMQKWFQCLSILVVFFKFINKTFFLFLDSPYLGILYFIQYCFSSFLKKDK